MQATAGGGAGTYSVFQYPFGFCHCRDSRLSGAAQNPLGRFVYAIGGNPEAARLAGVNVKRVLVSVYVVIGCLAGLAGFILSARLGSAEAVAGISFELRVIASVVIGGTSLMGGYGRIGGTIIGSIIMGILINGLVLMNVSAYYQQIITGLIIVLAVAFDTYAKNRRGAL